MPVIKPEGTKTAQSTSAIAMSAAPTSSMLLNAAARGDRPAAMLRSMFSTTTMASSTTMPTAKTSQNNEQNGFADRLLDFIHGLLYELRRIVDDGIGNPRRETLRELLHGRADG